MFALFTETEDLFSVVDKLSSPTSLAWHSHIMYNNYTNTHTNTRTHTKWLALALFCFIKSSSSTNYLIEIIRLTSIIGNSEQEF